MGKKIIPLLICLLLITTAILIAEAKKPVLSEENLMKSNEYLGANLSINPTSYDFGDRYIGEFDSTTFEIWNSGCCYLTYSLLEDCNWVNINPTLGSSTGEHDTITINIETSFLNPGLHQCDIQIYSNGGDRIFSIYINVSTANTPMLTYYPRSYDFGYILKGDTTSATFEIWNCGIDTLTYSLNEDSAWIVINPIVGSSTYEHDTITVDIKTGSMVSGLNIYDIQILSNGGNGLFRVSVNIKNPSAPELSYSPQSYNFGHKLKGEADFTTFEIWNSGIQTLTYSLIEHCDWITVYPNSGSSSGEHDTITVSIDTTGLEQYSNRYDISIDTNGGVGYFTVTVLIGEGYSDITVEQAWTFLTDTSNGIQIPIDVRYDNEWAVAHIDTPAPENPKHHCKCAWSDPIVLQDFMDLYQGKEIILYCKAGSRSTDAANTLVANNFTGVIYNMIGGIDGWIQAGHPTKANSPPNMPTISGESNGKIGQEYPYTFTATDVDQDDVYYLINWSDNTTDQLVGPYHSGEAVLLNHIWAEKGTYTVKAKTRDIYNSESDWVTLDIKMPKTSNTIFHQLLFRIFEKIHLFFLY